MKTPVMRNAKENITILGTYTIVNTQRYKLEINAEKTRYAGRSLSFAENRTKIPQ